MARKFITRPPTPSTAHKPPKFITSATYKGGVGKTTDALIAIDLLELHGETVHAVQLDTQDRLRKTIGRDVISLDVDTLRQTRHDPSAGLQSFRPLMRIIGAAAEDHTRVVFDIGGALAGHFLTFAALSGLDDDLCEIGIQGIVMVPALAEPEAISQAARTITRFREVLPSIRPVFIQNERDGAFSEMVQGSEAHRLYMNELQPVLVDVPTVTLPAVAGRSWQLFERHFCRPLDVVRMSVEEVMAFTDLPRSEAKIARGDVAAWVSQIEAGLVPVLGLGG